MTNKEKLREFRNTHVINKSDYSNIHHWLRRKYGNAKLCEMPECLGISKRFEWALVKGKKYQKKRKNFIQLCKSCHSKYDITPSTKNKLRTFFKGRKHPLWITQKKFHPVSMWTLDGKFVGTFKSVDDAASTTGTNPSSISKVLTGLYKKANNHKWKYE